MLLLATLLVAAPVPQDFEFDLVPPDRGEWRQGGTTVAVSGNWIALGDGVDPWFQPGVGQPMLFRRDSSGQGWAYDRLLLGTTPFAPSEHALVFEMEGRHLLFAVAGGVIAFRHDPFADDWVRIADLPQPTGLASPFSPERLALSGDRALICDRGGFASTVQLLHVYDYDAVLDTWAWNATIPQPQGTQSFGFWSDIDQDTIIAHSADSSSSPGRLEVFEEGPSGWSSTQRIEGAVYDPETYFGAAAAIEGDRIAISSESTTFVFERLGPGTPFQLATSFTATVADPVKLVGGDIFLGQWPSAQVEIWRRTPCSNGEYMRTHRLTTINKHNGFGSTSTHFGSDIAVDGAILVAGAPDYVQVGGPQHGVTVGAASVFRVPTDINGDGIVDACQLSSFEDVDGDGVLDVVESPGSRYCSPNVPTTLGVPATILMQGSAVVSENKLFMTMLGVPQGRFGLMLASLTPGFLPTPGTSAGTLCLGGHIGRRNGIVHSFWYAQDDNVIHKPFDLSFSPTHAGALMLPGETWRFQGWFRDGVMSSNFTDAMRVTLQ